MNELLQKVYDRCPSFIQNIGVSLYGLKIYRREYGKKFDKLFDEFEKRQWYSLAEIKEYQNEKLRIMIKHCYDNVPYYKKIMAERKLKPFDISSVDDLPKLPLLTRKDVKDNFSDLLASNMKRSQMIMGHTSGTTGSPLDLAWDRQICLYKNVVDWRQKKITGLSPGDRIAFFLGRFVVPLSWKKPPFWRHNWVLNHLFCSSWHMSQENLKYYLKKFRSFKPKAIEGYPSTMYILARYILTLGETMPLQAAFTSSESLMPYQREAIEKAFECRLFDFYGMAERVVFATECEVHKGKHLNMDFSITEVLDTDGNPSAYGELGRIVTTGLHNFAMPLVRYQTSDVTALIEKPCSCGRAFSLMESITTKDEDIITAKDGRYISSSIMNALTHHLTSIAEHQIIQEDRNHVVMKIVKLPSYSEKDTEYLLKGLKQSLGEGMSVKLDFVDSIPRTKAGKFRWVISKVPLEF